MLKQLNSKLSVLQGLGTENTPIFELHPLQISGYVEASWELWRLISSTSQGGIVKDPASLKTMPRAALPALGKLRLNGAGSQISLEVLDPVARLLQASSDDTLNKQVQDATKQILEESLNDFIPNPDGSSTVKADPVRHWDHLIYAYLLENTRVIEVCRKLIDDLLHDEVHGAFSDETQRWLRNTEDLFFRNGNSSFIASTTSWIRPDDAAVRRGAYKRFFGIDLNHGTADGQPYPYRKATIVNTEFVATFQDLLRELWRGYINSRNTSGANTTDDTNIAELLDRLQNMLNSRRLGTNGLSNLAREEFVAVTTLAWFELTLAGNSPVVRDLKATGATIEERLRQLAERVKTPMHSKARSFFILAKHLPRLLTLIEEGHFDETRRANIRALYAEVLLGGVPNTELRDGVLQIVNHWSIATGVDLKAVPTTSGAR